ncbi:intimin/invasin [Salmonella enterica subsp. arizonae]|uniref:Intimin/invasin n=1 Tax=Salmonella enterica subsp. arizonae TaxID=59203 RepID=A0A2X4TCA0_SALER|nr:intimin/invasin [Salmonella enterica subsp. arizonae]
MESETLTFMPDVKSATLSAITADKTAAQANGADAVTLSVKVEDANHNPIPGAQISWTTTSATAILSASDTSTDAKGNASISVTSTTVENVSVVATMKEQAQTSPDLQFTVDNATAAVESLNADKTQAVANQNDFITLTARVVDANDHPVPDSPLKWQIVEGQATLAQRRPPPINRVAVASH